MFNLEDFEGLRERAIFVSLVGLATVLQTLYASPNNIQGHVAEVGPKNYQSGSFKLNRNLGKPLNIYFDGSVENCDPYYIDRFVRDAFRQGDEITIEIGDTQHRESTFASQEPSTFYKLRSCPKKVDISLNE
jgi:hypothetical protein